MRTELKRWLEIPTHHADGGREYYYEFHVHVPNTQPIGPGIRTFDPPPGQQHHSEPSRAIRPWHGPRTGYGRSSGGSADPA